MIDQYFDYNKLNELASQFKKQYIKYCRTHDSLFSKIEELLSKIPIKAKEIYYKELSHPNNPRIIEIIYINLRQVQFVQIVMMKYFMVQSYVNCY